MKYSKIGPNQSNLKKVFSQMKV